MGHHILHWFDADTLTRFQLWRAALAAILHAPWDGYGYDGITLFTTDGKAFSAADRAHCELLDLALWYGVWAPALYVATLARVALHFVRAGRVSLVSALVAQFVASLFFFDNCCDYLMVVVLTAFAFSNANARPAPV